MLSAIKNYLPLVILTIITGFLISYSWPAVFIILALIIGTLLAFSYPEKALLVLIFYLPFQIALNISPGIDLASGRIFILALFSVWLFKSLAEKKIIITKNIQSFLLLLFLSLALFSFLQAWDMERAIRKFLVFLSVFPLYFLITALIKHYPKNDSQFVIRDSRFILKILTIIFLSAIILSSVGIVQFILQFIIGVDPIMDFWKNNIASIFYGRSFGAEVVANPSWLVNIGGATVLRAFSLFPDPHMFSFYLGLIIPIPLAFLLVYSRKKNAITTKKFFLKKKFILFLTFFILLVAELLTFSRGGYLGMIAGIGAVIILGWRFISFNKKVLLGIISVILILFIVFAAQPVLNRFISIADLSEGSNLGRLAIWQEATEVWQNNFFWGTGLGNYSIEIDPAAGYRAPIYAHNAYLDIATEMGVFALIVWLGLFLITFAQLFRQSRTTDSYFARALSLGLCGSLAWFSIHCLFETPIYSPKILAMLMVIIGLSAMVIEIKKFKKI
jgi:O-antigen ligase